MIRSIIFGQIRHLLTTAGGSLVAAGYLTVDELSTVVGAVIIVLGMALSYFEKRKHNGQPPIPRVKPRHYNACFILLALLMLSGCTTISRIVESVTDISCAKQVEVSSKLAVNAGEGVGLAYAEEKIDLVKHNQLVNALLDVHAAIESANAVCDLGDEDAAKRRLDEADKRIEKIHSEAGEV